MRAALDASRRLFDASRATVRAQQDFLLERAAASVQQADDGKLEAEEGVAASLASGPMLAALSAVTFWNDVLLRATGAASRCEIAD
jgi:hypothetical protein